MKKNEQVFDSKNLAIAVIGLSQHGADAFVGHKPGYELALSFYPSNMHTGICAQKNRKPRTFCYTNLGDNEGTLRLTPCNKGYTKNCKRTTRKMYLMKSGCVREKATKFFSVNWVLQPQAFYPCCHHAKITRAFLKPRRCESGEKYFFLQWPTVKALVAISAQSAQGMQKWLQVYSWLRSRRSNWVLHSTIILQFGKIPMPARRL